MLRRLWSRLVRALATKMRQWAETMLARTDEAEPATAIDVDDDLDATGPPAHWLERVRRDAPQLLEPPSAEGAPPRVIAQPPPLDPVRTRPRRTSPPPTERRDIRVPDARPSSEARVPPDVPLVDPLAMERVVEPSMSDRQRGPSARTEMPPRPAQAGRSMSPVPNVPVAIRRPSEPTRFDARAPHRETARLDEPDTTPASIEAHVAESTAPSPSAPRRRAANAQPSILESRSIPVTPERHSNAKDTRPGERRDDRAVERSEQDDVPHPPRVVWIPVEVDTERPEHTRLDTADATPAGNAASAPRTYASLSWPVYPAAERQLPLVADDLSENRWPELPADSGSDTQDWSQLLSTLRRARSLEQEQRGDV